MDDEVEQALNLIRLPDAITLYGYSLHRGFRGIALRADNLPKGSTCPDVAYFTSMRDALSWIESVDHPPLTLDESVQNTKPSPFDRVDVPYSSNVDTVITESSSGEILRASSGDFSPFAGNEHKPEEAGDDRRSEEIS